MLDSVSDGSNPLPRLALDPSPAPKTRTSVRLELVAKAIMPALSVGVPNSLGRWHDKPEQDFGELSRAVRDSAMPPTQTPRDPDYSVTGGYQIPGSNR